jgi:cytidine deaminase
MKKKYLELIEVANKAKMNAFAPFSNFKVGAALLTYDGKIFTGCNIENSSFGLTICAERVAIFKAISSGSTRFKAMAIISDHKGFTSPCGACRQVLYDLAGNIEIVLATSNNRMKIQRLGALLPFAFAGKILKHLKKEK